MICKKAARDEDFIFRSEIGANVVWQKTGVRGGLLLK
jgi:hypothetical protein